MSGSLSMESGEAKQKYERGKAHIKAEHVLSRDHPFNWNMWRHRAKQVLSEKKNQQTADATSSVEQEGHSEAGAPEGHGQQPPAAKKARFRGQITARDRKKVMSGNGRLDTTEDDEMSMIMADSVHDSNFVTEWNKDWDVQQHVQHICCPFMKSVGRCPFRDCAFASEPGHVHDASMDRYDGSLRPINYVDRNTLNQIRSKDHARPHSAAFAKVWDAYAAYREKGSFVTLNFFQYQNERKTHVPRLYPSVDGATSSENPTWFEAPKKWTFDNKLILAPLTTVGNLPFRAICKMFGADITVSEMALAPELCAGSQSEWALLKRHPSEDIFGVQVACSMPGMAAECGELIRQYAPNVDFVDLNCGCPLEPVVDRGMGCGLSLRRLRWEGVLCGLQNSLRGTCPVTAKIRIGHDDKQLYGTKLVKQACEMNLPLVTVHGRTRAQRYSKLASWEYIAECQKVPQQVPNCRTKVIGNGDIFCWEDVEDHKTMIPEMTSFMIGRGALIKPWLFTEIKEKRHWDISASERLDVIKKFVDLGLEHWGSDSHGVSATRRFLLEWMSFSHRYVPVGILEHVPARITDRPEPFCGRSDLESWMASPYLGDWMRLSELFLGPPSADFKFVPKHKSNAWAPS
eukprot:ANDGO_05710.mRNA.1 hypothetical protein